MSHPAICPVHEVGEADGSPYIVMARLRGQRLVRALESATLEETLVVMREVALAMHEAHRAGLIHRDLKPANVMVEVGADGRRRAGAAGAGDHRAGRATPRQSPPLPVI